MTNYSVTNADDFIAAAPAIAKPHLKAIRQAVESVLPEIEKDFGYGKPYYKYKGWVAGFDAYKNHIGFEVWDGLTTEDRDALEALGYKTGSATFQVRYDQAVPAKIIQKLVKAQVAINEAKPAKGK